MKLLETNNYVSLVSFDFFKTCDVVQHSTLAAKLSSIDLPDNIFNWLVDFLMQQSSLNGFRPWYPKVPGSYRAGEFSQLPSLSIHLTSIWYIPKIGWSNMLMTCTCSLDPLREPRLVRIWNQLRNGQRQMPPAQPSKDSTDDCCLASGRGFIPWVLYGAFNRWQPLSNIPFIFFI